MLEWFNSLISIFAGFVDLLFDLPFYGSVSIGLLLVCLLIFNVVLVVLIHRIK